MRSREDFTCVARTSTSVRKLSVLTMDRKRPRCGGFVLRRRRPCAPGRAGRNARVFLPLGCGCARFATVGTPTLARYHKQMRFLTLLIAVTLWVAPRAWAQALPDLGDPSGGALSPQMERRIGETIARDIRYRDPSYLDDPEVNEYLSELGQRLVAASPGARLDFEFFAIRDPAINAFALPGGFVAVHTGLLLARNRSRNSRRARTRISQSRSAISRACG